VLSQEHTGGGPEIHLDSPVTEWLVAFCESGRVERMSDIEHGFLVDDHSDMPTKSEYLTHSTDTQRGTIRKLS
jgi:hypothetical protein